MGAVTFPSVILELIFPNQACVVLAAELRGIEKSEIRHDHTEFERGRSGPGPCTIR